MRRATAIVGLMLSMLFSATGRAVEFELESPSFVLLSGPGETFTVEFIVTNRDQDSIAGVSASVYDYETFATFVTGQAVPDFFNATCFPLSGCVGGLLNTVDDPLQERTDGAAGARVPIAEALSITPVSNPGVGVDLGIDGFPGSPMFSLTFIANASGTLQVGTAYPDPAASNGVFLGGSSRVEAIGFSVEVVVGSLDTDGDGLSDLVETNTGVWVDVNDRGTDPLDDDSDDDGIPDGAESNSGVFVSPFETGTNPNTFDSDLDGVADGPEVAAGSDPSDAGSLPRIEIETVTVGDPGNAPDTTGYGAVPLDFTIGRYEVTNREYAIFLNSVAVSDPRSLWNPSMVGIQRFNASGSHRYAPVNGADQDAVEWISLWDAARFVNWLENDQPAGPQGPATTEDGTYSLAGATENETTLVARATSPGYFLPSEDQWYKAAYYAGGSTYQTYPFRSSTPPVCTAPGSTANSANCDRVVGTTTAVGAYPASLGRDGQFDQGGNVQEWIEWDGTGSAITRGGDWFSGVADMASSHRSSRVPFDASFNTGFRIAAATVTVFTSSTNMQNPNIPRKSCQAGGVAFMDDRWRSVVSCTVTADACSGASYCANDGSACDPFDDPATQCSGFSCADPRPLRLRRGLSGVGHLYPDPVHRVPLLR